MNNLFVTEVDSESFVLSNGSRIEHQFEPSEIPTVEVFNSYYQNWKQIIKIELSEDSKIG